jgi:Zn-dependent protease
MVPSWRIGRAFGIDLYIHWTFWLLPAWLALSGLLGTGSQLALGLAVLAAVFGCVLLHELGHALTARGFGIGTRDITLYPIGGVARLEGMSERPSHELWIALAGPAVNLVIAALLTTVLTLVAAFDPGLVFGSVGGLFLFQVLAGNVFLVLFNLLPAFPMDGGRVLRALLAMGLGQLRATKVAAVVGAGMAVLIGLGGYYYLHNPFLVVIALFVFVAGQAELQAAYLREHKRRLREQEPPAVRPLTDPPAGLFYLQPRVTVYTWDEQTGTWVKERDDRGQRVL